MQMEDEEDPWAGLGMGEAGEILPGISTNVEILAEDASSRSSRASRNRLCRWSRSCRFLRCNSSKKSFRFRKASLFKVPKLPRVWDLLSFAR